METTTRASTGTHIFMIMHILYIRKINKFRVLFSAMARTRLTIFDKSMVVFAIAVNMVYSRSNSSVEIAVCRNGGYEDQRYECQVI